MRPAGHFPDRRRRTQVEAVISGIGIGLEIARVVRQERRRPVPLAAGREVVHVVGMVLVPVVEPEPRRQASRPIASQRLDRRVVGPDDRGEQHQPLLEVVERPQQLGRLADPIAERGPRQVQAVADGDVLEAVQGQMIDKLGDQQLREQTRARDASRERAVRSVGTRHPVVTVRAGVLGEDVKPELQPGRDEFEFASLVLADPRLGPAAARAGLVGFGHVVLDADLGQAGRNPSFRDRRGFRGAGAAGMSERGVGRPPRFPRLSAKRCPCPGSSSRSLRRP